MCTVKIENTSRLKNKINQREVASASVYVNDDKVEDIYSKGSVTLAKVKRGDKLYLKFFMFRSNEVIIDKKNTQLEFRYNIARYFLVVFSNVIFSGSLIIGTALWTPIDKMENVLLPVMLMVIVVGVGSIFINRKKFMILNECQ